MNNSNNPTRIIIDLDGSLDELDDDDITLPDLPSAEDIPIIETPRVEQQREVTPASTLQPEPKPVESKPVEPKPVAPAVQQTTADTQPLTQTSAQKAQQAEEDKKRGGWFSRMKSGLTKSRKNLAEGVANILIGGKEIDDELLEEVEDQLLVADIGVEATDKIIKSLTEQTARGDLIYSHSLYKALQKELVEILEPKVAPLIIDTSKKPFVILVVGVNGVGKTTTIGKLAKRLQAEGKSVMLAAGDTFRAAATEQLQIWGERNNIPVVAQGHGADSASVVFDAMQSAKAKNIDVLIADTAGRLQNKTHLMAELEKVVRIMRKSDPTAPHEGMIVLDAGTGQNAINQVKIFNDAVPLTGITITKLDGTAKGGVVFNIANTTDIPIRYIGVGESIDDLRAFSPKQFVAALFETDE
ncbi:signal recognition particle-docking protein FtsY [Psychrobacter sanguinis]|uniref:signal recognition particle-docking protein FtsY n=1 Tax=Psychrobacter sanguinis TaxID=861445 RepID=UPI002A74C8BC|nr:signal recognition particle-docking protein FtsY [Psychrobacter sanguinis]MDY3305175.1 signal recognition particle-docking protein FtsY [Psychrobacter sanguinis]